MATLYEVEKDLEEAFDSLTLLEEQVDPKNPDPELQEQIELAKQMFDMSIDNAKEKFNAYAMLIKNKTADIAVDLAKKENFAKEAKRYENRAKANQRTIDSLKERMKLFLLKSDDKDHQLITDSFKFSVSKNPSSVDCDELLKLADQSIQYIPSPASNFANIHTYVEEYNKTEIGIETPITAEEVEKAIKTYVLPKIEMISNKNVLASALKANKFVPGAELKQSTRLTIS